MDEPQNGVQRSLGKIEGKLDGVIEKLDALVQKTESQNTRITKIENTENYHRGITAAISVVISALITGIGLFLKLKGK